MQHTLTSHARMNSLLTPSTSVSGEYSTTLASQEVRLNPFWCTKTWKI